MAKGWILVLILVCAVAPACQRNSAVAGNRAATPAPTNSAIPKPSPTPESSKIKTYNGRGVVTKINLELVSVELNHEEIQGLMPAMIMEFFVKEKSELEVLKLGDKVEFVLEDNAGSERIISIKKS